MNIAIISFSRNGIETAVKAGECLKKENHHVTEAVKCSGFADSIQATVTEWTGLQFAHQDALIFIGACGIAVRAIAPYIQSKTKDPAVLVIDEKGTYCIPILSGHIGGANELAIFLSEKLLLHPVITTATDIHGKWAVDVFAVKNHLTILGMEKAKRIAARLIHGETITIQLEEEAQVAGKLPESVKIFTPAQGKKEPDIYIGVRKKPDWKQTLYLVPKAVTVGIGCKKGTEEEKIEAAVSRITEKEGIFEESLCQAASIELKAEEKGILSYCEKYHLKFKTYSAEKLCEVQGEFKNSEFVKEITGVGNVCERSAVCASEVGRLLAEKQAMSGVTIALAVQKWGVSFE